MTDPTPTPAAGGIAPLPHLPVPYTPDDQATEFEKTAYEHLGWTMGPGSAATASLYADDVHALLGVTHALRSRLDAYHVTGSEADELRRRRADDLEVRGILKPDPSAGVDAVPMTLGDTIAPAIRWLVDDRDRLVREACALSERLGKTAVNRDNWAQMALERGAATRRVLALARRMEADGECGWAEIREAVAGHAQPTQERPTGDTGASEHPEAPVDAAGALSDEEINDLAGELEEARSVNGGDALYNPSALQALAAGDRLLAEVRRLHARPAPGLAARAARELVDALRHGSTFHSSHLIDVLTNMLTELDGEWALRQRSDRGRHELAQELAEARQALTELKPAKPPIHVTLDADTAQITVDAGADDELAARILAALTRLITTLARVPDPDATRETAGLDVDEIMELVNNHGGMRYMAAMARARGDQVEVGAHVADALAVTAEIRRRLAAGTRGITPPQQRVIEAARAWVVYARELWAREEPDLLPPDQYDQALMDAVDALGEPEPTPQPRQPREEAQAAYDEAVVDAAGYIDHGDADAANDDGPSNG